MNDGTVAPEKLTINGQEYASEDASQLIELGNKYREYEKNLNTSLDKIVPEYTKATQKAARLEEAERKLSEYETRLKEFETKQIQSQIPEDIQSVREAARKAGLATDDYLKEQGYMTKAEFEEMFNQKQTQQKLVDNILTKASGLEKQIDGSDGRVPFDTDAVLAYASAYNIDDLEEAYDRMNTKANARWKEAQLARAEKPGLSTLRGGGKKEPERAKVTDDNFKTMWDELYNNNE